jgi:hypothetical protein
MLRRLRMQAWSGRPRRAQEGTLNMSFLLRKLRRLAR